MSSGGAKIKASVRVKHKDWVASLPPTRAVATSRAILEPDSTKPGMTTRFFVSLEAMRWFRETIGYTPALQRSPDYQEYISDEKEMFCFPAYFFDFDRPEDAMLFEIRFPRR